MDWISNVYLICAVTGGVLLVAQTILAATTGGDAGADGPDGAHVGELDPSGAEGVGHHDASFFKWLSLKVIVAALTFFGLAGLASEKAGIDRVPTLAIALAAGTASVFLVAFLMSSLGKLQSRGNLDMQNAVGTSGKVYLRIPPGRGGHGKVTLVVQGRSVEVEAVTQGPGLPTGADVRVVSLLSPNVVIVESNAVAR